MENNRSNNRFTGIQKGIIIGVVVLYAGILMSYVTNKADKDYVDMKVEHYHELVHKDIQYIKEAVTEIKQRQIKTSD